MWSSGRRIKAEYPNNAIRYHCLADIFSKYSKQVNSNCSPEFQMWIMCWEFMISNSQIEGISRRRANTQKYRFRLGRCVSAEYILMNPVLFSPSMVTATSAAWIRHFSSAKTNLNFHSFSPSWVVLQLRSRFVSEMNFHLFKSELNFVAESAPSSVAVRYPITRQLHHHFRAYYCNSVICEE